MTYHAAPRLVSLLRRGLPMFGQRATTLGLPCLQCSGTTHALQRPSPRYLMDTLGVKRCVGISIYTWPGIYREEQLLVGDVFFASCRLLLPLLPSMDWKYGSPIIATILPINYEGFTSRRHPLSMH